MVDLTSLSRTVTTGVHERFPDAQVICPAGARAKVEQVVPATGDVLSKSQTSLLELTEEIAVRKLHLFAPMETWRIRFDNNTDTPLPPDEPFAQNPAEGALVLK